MPSPEVRATDQPPLSATPQSWLGPVQLRWGLACLWILDAGLQLQPDMFTRAFAGNVVYNAALMYQPAGLEQLLYRAASVEASHLLALSLLIAAVQLALGVGLLLPRLCRPALLASVGWASLVWIFGQGFGFMATGTAMIEFGAPGSALMYIALSALAWPQTEGVARGSGPARARLAREIWSSFWALGAILHIPIRFSAGTVLAYNFQTAAQLQPRPLQALDYHLARLAFTHSLAISLGLVLIELVLAAAIWLPRGRRPALLTGLLLTAAFWVLGQAMGGMLTGVSTDPATGPLVVLLALSLGPTPPGG
ncbi:MAG: hypothetical protein ACYCZN_01035 [Candidatus Dormibacteria bacterium]